MTSDDRPSALTSLLNLMTADDPTGDPVEEKVEEVAEAWAAYEAGMDWDPSYLANMGTLDMDTEEFAAVDVAIQELKALSTAMGDDVTPLTKAIIIQLLDAYQDLCAMGWRADGAHEEAARHVSAALGIPFTGRHGGGSTNNPC